LAGKSILLWREQGIGDEILFSSCIPDLLLRYPESSVYFECENRLQDIFSKSIKGLKILNQEQTPPQNFDYHLPIGSLMKFFRRDIKSFEGKGAFLSADNTISESFKARLAPYSSKKIIGLCWRSGLISPTRNVHYTAISDWTFLNEIKERYVFVNLQYGDCEEELVEVEKKWQVEIIRWKDVDLKNDMDQVFALVSNLDAVVTVGTSVSAISGSLGVPTIYLAKRGWLFLGQKKLPWFDNFYSLIPQEDEIVATQLSRVPEALEKVLAVSSATGV
jgi:ADP-heptose:LPS heptosyltransferase